MTGHTSGNGLHDSLARFATRRPRTVYALVLAATVAAIAMLPRIHIDTDPENMLPATQADRLFHDTVEKRFVLHDAIVVGIVNESDPNGIYNVQTLGALHAIGKQILGMDGVIAPDLMSLAEADNIGQEGPGTIRFEWMMKDRPASAAQALAIREKVERLPLLLNTVVSGDGRAAAIYVPIERKDLSYAIARDIRERTEALAGDDTWHITGLPVAEDTFGHDMFVQMGISAPLAGLMIFLLMLYFFRSATLVIAPMLVAMASVLITMGLLIGMGFTVHIMSSMIPIFLMPIAVVDSVHIMSEFADTYRPGDDVRAAINKVLGHLFTPMLFTSLTSVVGFASLLLTPIPPVQVFGAFVAFGILLAFLITIVLIPAYVVRMRPAALEKLARRDPGRPVDTPLARVLRATGRFSLRYGKTLSLLAVLFIAFSAVGISRIGINDNPVRWFKANHPIRVADDALNRHFAGTYDAFLVLSAEPGAAVERVRADAIAQVGALDAGTAGPLRDLLAADARDANAWFGSLIAALDDALFATADPAGVRILEELMESAEAAQTESRLFQRPDMLQRIEELQGVLQRSGVVGKTNALPDVVKVVNRELRGGAEADYRLPDSAAGVAQTLLQYQSSHRPGDLWHMVTPDFSSAAIWLQLKSGDNEDMSRVIQTLEAHLAEHPMPADIDVRWAGKTYINVVWQDAMVKGMLYSLAGAFLTVFVMMSLLFRSVRLGLLAMVPLSVTIVGVYGIIGWIGKDYDMPIAVLSSLTLGLSVDFAIHFIERCRSLLRSERTPALAMQSMFEEPARAIARNAIVIAIGFTPLFFAPLVPYITVGAFMASIMALSGVTTLVLLPAILSWAGPWLFPAERKEGAFAVQGAAAGNGG